MKRILVAGFALAVGIALLPTANDVALTASINNTGPKSINIIRSGHSARKRRTLRVQVSNDNNVNLRVHTHQAAQTGDATVAVNTTGGNATSGNSENNNGLLAVVDILNGGHEGNQCDLCSGSEAADAAAIVNTGPKSTNIIVDGCGCGGYQQTNSNDIGLNVGTGQHADTGDAKVLKNTEGGDATSGDATNNNNTQVDIVIENGGYSGGGCDECGGDGDTATIDTTGPLSHNVINLGGCGCGGGGVSIDNSNNIMLNIGTHQSANTGDASVFGNTTGGSANSGSATNTNATGIGIGVSN